MRRSEKEISIPFDPEIERTLRRRLAQLRITDEMAEPINEDDIAMNEYALPTKVPNPGIVAPTITSNTFEMKPVMFQMLMSMGQFQGLATEDPHLHLRKFIGTADSFKIHGLTTEGFRLKLFPFSLRDLAQAWYTSLPEDSITTWAELVGKFLGKYFPPAKTAQLRK